MTICRKGFQSHFIASISLTLTVSNFLNCLITKLTFYCLMLSLCSFSTSLNHCRHFWYSKNSCKELANDYVLLIAKRFIIWETETTTSSPRLTCIQPNSENNINIQITNIQKMNKINKLIGYLNDMLSLPSFSIVWNTLGGVLPPPIFVM